MIKVLILEDSPEDAELMVDQLEESGHIVEVRIVSDELSFRSDIHHFKPDIILSDYKLPKINGLEALLIALEVDPLIPFIFVTGTIGEEIAAETILNGASGLVLKDNLKKLPHLVERILSTENRQKTRMSFVIDRVNNRIEENVQALNRINDFLHESPGKKSVSEELKKAIGNLDNIRKDLNK